MEPLFHLWLRRNHDDLKYFVFGMSDANICEKKNLIDFNIYENYWFQTGVPHYEDFISKAGKLHGHLK